MWIERQQSNNELLSNMWEIQLYYWLKFEEYHTNADLRLSSYTKQNYERMTKIYMYDGWVSELKILQGYLSSCDCGYHWKSCNFNILLFGFLLLLTTISKYCMICNIGSTKNANMLFISVPLNKHQISAELLIALKNNRESILRLMKSLKNPNSSKIIVVFHYQEGNVPESSGVLITSSADVPLKLIKQTYSFVIILRQKLF